MLDLLTLTAVVLLAQRGFAISLGGRTVKSASSVDVSVSVTRRNAFFYPIIALIPATIYSSPWVATATQSEKADMIAELQNSRDKLAPIPQLLEEKEWEKVRNILKTPPVNKLWNLGEVSTIG